MKRCLVLFGFVILFGSFAPAYAVTFEVEIEPGKTFVHPDDGLTYYKANTDFYLDIKIGGTPGTGEIGWFSMTFRIYAKINGVESDAIPIIWIDAGGTDFGGSLTRMNGWEDGTYWSLLNDVVGFSWDGSLPDTMNHATASLTGMPDTEPLMTRFRFHFSVPVLGFDPQTDVVEICIDQSNHPDPIYTWNVPFPFPVDFGGPYCFHFAASACGDANLDGGINILDVVYIINYKYKAGPPPLQLELCDVNHDGSVNILDIVYIINYKYKGGPAPNCPAWE